MTDDADPVFVDRRRRGCDPRHFRPLAEATLPRPVVVAPHPSVVVAPKVEGQGEDGGDAGLSKTAP